MTPPRLLSTTRNGFERELLRAAGTDRAPGVVRARVLASVAQASTIAEHATGLRSAHSADGSRRAERARARHPGGQRARWWVPGTSLSILTLAAGIALVICRPLLEPSSAPSPGTGVQTADTSPQAMAARNAAPPLAGAPPALTALPAQPQWGHTSTRPLEPAPEPARLQSLPEDDASDWLGAQLRLLGEARRQLRTGALQQAEALLDSYERRFPGGVVGPQVSALRSELRLQRAQRLQQP